jgi:sensor histidine kinase regulating citrate/malate metabolism
VIPAAVAQRIFQRHFSTKSVDGRGFGTYSIKLLGKTFLGGRASFFSSDRVGTEFRFFLPYKNL